MTAKLVAESERALEVEVRAFAPIVGRSPGNGLARDIHREPVVTLVDDGQADARAGDGSAEIDRIEIVGSPNDQPQITALFRAAHLPDVGHDPGEHGLP